MSWLLEFRPEIANDVVEAAEWYESRETGLRAEFVDEIMEVWDSIAGIGLKREEVKSFGRYSFSLAAVRQFKKPELHPVTLFGTACWEEFPVTLLHKRQ